jgi:hypothetical protein
MSDLTVDEKMKFAQLRAAEKAAEIHFFNLYKPDHFPMGFSVFRRDAGHYDITAAKCPGSVEAFYANNPEGRTSATEPMRERAFCIRGSVGKVFVRDERWDPTRPHPRESLTFKTVTMAMLWITEELMQEPTNEDR